MIMTMMNDDNDVDFLSAFGHTMYSALLVALQGGPKNFHFISKSHRITALCVII